MRPGMPGTSGASAGMNADEHFRNAHKYLEEAKRRTLDLQKDDGFAAQEIQILLQIAQVHATLAAAPQAQRIPPSHGQPGAPR
jgi:predicted metal-dependent hydrolase